ncbi:MAG: hypothetical protein ACI9VS_004194, partial [Candidatus Binatia bacterium]
MDKPLVNKHGREKEKPQSGEPHFLPASRRRV